MIPNIINTLKKILKQIRLLTETGLAYFAYYLFKFISLDISTKVGYFIGYYLLGNFPSQRKKEVLQNIARVFPNYSKQQVAQLYKKSCGNFCSVIAEMPHILTMGKLHRVHLVDKTNILPSLQNSNSLLFSAHIGNWELIGYPYYENKINAKQYVIYKPPGNPYLHKLFANMRKYNSNYEMITLSKQMLMQLYTSFKKSPTSLTMLVDQRIKEGILVPFLDKIAYTSPILPMLAIKQNIPLIPIRSIRNQDKTFTIEIGELLTLNTDESNLPESEQIALLTTKMNAVIGAWIKEYPTQWFWLHRRW